MSKIEIDFNTLKYNLYEILNVNSNATEKEIKTSFMKVIKTFHPDKNSELEEEIYYHIILSNQILLNKESRFKYDIFLNDTAETFIDLKNNFDKIKKENLVSKNEKESIALFKNQFEQLNKKHGYSDNINSISVLDKFNKVKSSRDNIEIKIDKEEIKDSDEFNKKFYENKTVGKLKSQIIEYKGEVSSYVSDNNYTSLSNMNELYLEGSILSDKFSSLDLAFGLQPVIEYNNKKSLEEKINDYNKESKLYDKKNFKYD